MVSLEIVVPSISITAETPVAVVDTVVDRRGTRQVADLREAGVVLQAGQETGQVHEEAASRSAARSGCARAGCATTRSVTYGGMALNMTVEIPAIMMAL